jgi:hypothetical protein
MENIFVNVGQPKQQKINGLNTSWHVLTNLFYYIDCFSCKRPRLSAAATPTMILPWFILVYKVYLGLQGKSPAFVKYILDLSVWLVSNIELFLSYALFSRGGSDFLGSGRARVLAFRLRLFGAK